MFSLNPTILARVVSKARTDAAAHPRWTAAIERAVRELESNPYIERGDNYALIIGSPSGNVYSSNGICQCLAYVNGQPCWHRAASRLVRLHDEALDGHAAYAQRKAQQELDECFA